MNYTGTDPDAIKAQIDYILGHSIQIMGDVLYFREDFKDFAKDLKNFPGCPIRMTGASPTLFIYDTLDKELSVTINSNLLYVDPPIPRNTWNIFVTPEGINSNGYIRPYIYYEYEKQQFNRPNQGWNMNKSEIKYFSKKLAKQMALTEIEEQRLYNELTQAEKDLKSDNIFIGIIDSKEIDSRIPLSINPRPSVTYRYHFYIGNQHSIPVKPTIKPLERTNSMILELGAVGYED